MEISILKFRWAELFSAEQFCFYGKLYPQKAMT